MQIPQKSPEPKTTLLYPCSFTIFFKSENDTKALYEPILQPTLRTHVVLRLAHGLSISPGQLYSQLPFFECSLNRNVLPPPSITPTLKTSEGLCSQKTWSIPRQWMSFFFYGSTLLKVSHVPVCTGQLLTERVDKTFSDGDLHRTN